MCVEHLSDVYAGATIGIYTLGPKTRKAYQEGIEQLRKIPDSQRIQELLEENSQLPLFDLQHRRHIQEQNQWLVAAQDGLYLELPKAKWWERFRFWKSETRSVHIIR